MKFINIDVEIKYGVYADGQTAIQLIAADTEHNHQQDIFTGEPVATASVYVEGSVLNEGETLIKNWSENSGILELLVQYGIVEDLNAVVRTGHCVANIVKVVDINYNQE